ncbi:hypothetical protein MTO96_048575 [Rhipicephalus appendiculatus]
MERKSQSGAKNGKRGVCEDDTSFLGAAGSFSPEAGNDAFFTSGGGNGRSTLHAASVNIRHVCRRGWTVVAPCNIMRRPPWVLLPGKEARTVAV